MAKMIDALRTSVRLSTLARLREQRTFIADYLPILERSIEANAEAKAARRHRDDLARLRDAAIAAGVAEPAVDAERTAALDRVRGRYKMKRRALAQSRKRALAKGLAADRFETARTTLDASEAAALAAVERRYAPTATDLDGAKTAYEAKRAAVAAATDAAVAAVVRKRDLKLAAVRSTYAARLARIDARIAERADRLQSGPIDGREARLRKRIVARSKAHDRKSSAVVSAADATIAAIIRRHDRQPAGGQAVRPEDASAAVAATIRKRDARLALIRSKQDARLARIDALLAKRAAKRKTHADDASRAVLPDGVILSVRNLTMRFGGLRAVDDLSFDVREGEIFGLIGPNGAGKTTIFNCITRFYRATAGEMYYRKNLGQVIRLNDYPVHDIIRQGIVRTFQNVELVWELPILDNLLVAAHTVYRTGFFGQLFHTPKLRREEEVLRAKAFSVLKTLDLVPYAHAIPYGLPYGILKKIELARTLMAHPRLIILDEPAAGLNDRETEDLAKLMKRIRDEQHATIFLVEHDMGLVMDVCDTICAISFGKKLAIGTPAEIQADKAVKSAYLGEES